MYGKAITFGCLPVVPKWSGNTMGGSVPVMWESALTLARHEARPGIAATTGLWLKIQDSGAGRADRHGADHRAVPPSAMLRRIRPLLVPAGITRLADLTGLDCLGIPVYQAVRPGSRNLSVAQGKGVTRVNAKVAALMEALEFFHAEEVAAPRTVAALGDMRRSLRYDPAVLLRPSWGELPDGLDIEWVEATDLTDGSVTHVPVQLCEMDATATERLARINFLPASNGLASGGTFAEAVSHGLYELLERDAVAADERLRFSAERALRCETVDDAVCRRLIGRLREVGRLHVHVPRSPTGRPCFEAFFEADDIPHLTFFGAACRSRRQAALAGALLEAAQSRLTYIAGARDDLDVRQYPGYGRGPAAMPAAVTGPAWPDRPEIDFRAVPDARPSGRLADLREVAALVRLQTGAAPIAVDLSRDEMGLPVVHVVAPGLDVNHFRH